MRFYDKFTIFIHLFIKYPHYSIIIRLYIKKIKEGLKKIDICPTCLQDVDPVYKSNAINKMDSDFSENIKKIKEFLLEKENLSRKISEVSNNLFEKQNEKSELEKLKIKVQTSEEKEERLEEVKRNKKASGGNFQTKQKVSFF